MRTLHRPIHLSVKARWCLSIKKRSALSSADVKDVAFVDIIIDALRAGEMGLQLDSFSLICCIFEQTARA